MNRVLYSEALIEFDKFRTGDIGLDDITRLSCSIRGVVDAPIYIDDIQLVQGSGHELNRITKI